VNVLLLFTYFFDVTYLGVLVRVTEAQAAWSKDSVAAIRGHVESVWGRMAVDLQVLYCFREGFGNTIRRCRCFSVLRCANINHVRVFLI